jgi:SAM-dependent methyltransferase
LSAWLDGIQFEINFWTDWMKTRGSHWPEEFAMRLDPNREVDTGLLEGIDSANPKVLDVGAGPASFFGHKLNGKPISLYACDPLASLYADVSSRNGIVWPVQTASGFAEDLSAFYDPCSFDLVVCRNALDHSFDPVRGIEEMLRVLRVGGGAKLIHFANEAEKNRYSGFHQWNFDIIENRPAIWNKSESIDLLDRFEAWADVTFKKEGETVHFNFRKKAELELPDTRERSRIAELLLAMRDAFISRAATPVKKEKRAGRSFVISASNPAGVERKTEGE